jgi:TusA-related sulfurtransferase
VSGPLQPQPDLAVDCRGRRCPLPILDLARRIGDVPIGGAIAVDADDPAAAHDIPAWCRMRAHRYGGATIAPDGAPRYLVIRAH